MKGQWLAPCQGQGFGQHHGAPMVAHALATKTGVGIGLSTRMRALRPAFLGAAGCGPSDPYPGMDLPRRSEQVERRLSVLADVQRLVPEEGGAGA